MASSKLTTGLTGLSLAKHPHHTLNTLYERIQRCLVKMPKESAYRRYTEELVQSRHAIVKSERNIAKVEEKIGAGQIEEVILTAEKELKLARNMLDWKPWEPLIRDPPAGQWKWPL